MTSSPGDDCRGGRVDCRTSNHVGTFRVGRDALHRWGTIVTAPRSIAAEAVAPMTDSAIIRLSGVEKEYRTGKLSYRALRGVDSPSNPERWWHRLYVRQRQDDESEPRVRDRTDPLRAPDGDRAAHRHPRRGALATWRGRHIGIVLQFFQLLPTLSAMEDAVMPTEFARVGTALSGRHGLAQSRSGGFGGQG